MYLENFVDLIRFSFTLKNGFHCDQLAEDAADRPDVDRRRVFFGAEQEFGRAVPQSDNDRSVRFERRSVFSGQSEIAHFQNTPVAQQQIGRLQVAVKDPVIVQMSHSTQQLLQKTLDFPCARNQ